MRKDPLNYLTKKELIAVIKTNKEAYRQANMKLIGIAYEKINRIVDKQAECDLATSEGLAKYVELEAEYKKWIRIQERI